MSTAPKKCKVGELRPSQVLTTFGVGAVVDLPHLSVMVMGLEDWPLRDTLEVYEERLLASVRQVLGRQVDTLRSAPIMPESSSLPSNPFEEAAHVGIPVAPFPRWMVCPRCRRLAPLSSQQFRLKPDIYRPDRVQYVHEICQVPGKPPTAVPARFVVACKYGHLDDFPWVEFVHRGPTQCKYKLKFIELGASGEAAELEVHCEICKASRRMADAFGTGVVDLPTCRGRRPHLRDFEENGCKTPEGQPTPMKAMLQGASDSWFAVMLSALALPKSPDKLTQLVSDNWTDLYDIESEGEITKLRRRNLLRDFSEYSEAELLQAIQAKRNQGEGVDEEEATELKPPEWEIFSNPNSVAASKDFKLRIVNPPSRYAKYIEKVVLAERLREVRALIGFTRIESPGDYDSPADFPADQRARLSRGKPTWVPASEIRGEGLFFQFSENEIQKWLARLNDSNAEYWEAHRRWRIARGLTPPEEYYPGLRFILLHSFAHALIRQLSVECGYTTASLRERIYSRDPGTEEAMAGVLIYTAAPDSEGTLGGLVSLGEPQFLERHLDQALDAMRLCASDPLCAEHRPLTEGVSLHGAACHACLFAPETSCERGNKYLDRSVLVPTVDRDDLAFFVNIQ